MELGVRPEGRVTIEVGDRRLEFDNLVLNSGFDSMMVRAVSADEAMVPKFLRFGTGDEEPVLTDTGLHAPYGPIKAHTGIAYGGLVDAGTLTAYSQAIVRFDFAPGELSGARLNELALSYNADGTEVYNRAMIRDENGIATSLVCLPDQAVTVYIRLRLFLRGWGDFIAVNGITGTIQMNGNIQSTTNGLWIKGFPFLNTLMAGATGLREGYTPGDYGAKFYTPIAPWTTFTSTQIDFRARSNVTMMSLNFGFQLVKPANHSLHFRIRIAVAREQ